MIFRTQQQSRVGSHLSVSFISASVSMTQTRTAAMYAGFTLGSRLPEPHSPGFKGGLVARFVAYSVTTQVSIQANYRFSVPLQRRPQVEDGVHALFERARQHPASATLFAQTTYQATMTTSVLYFSYACWQAQSPAKAAQGVVPGAKPIFRQIPEQPAASNGPAPSFKPAPQAADVPAPARVPASLASATERLGATVSLKPVEVTGKSDSSEWKDLSGLNPKKARYELWDMEKKNKWRPVALSLTDSPTVERKVTPQQLARDGLSFSAVNENNTVESIPLDKVKSFNVLTA